jgi:hypothetical protein
MGFRDSEELVVNHLLFVDDMLIFCGALCVDKPCSKFAVYFLMF